MEIVPPPEGGTPLPNQDRRSRSLPVPSASGHHARRGTCRRQVGGDAGRTCAPEAIQTRIVEETGLALGWLAAHGSSYGIAGSLGTPRVIDRRASRRDAAASPRRGGGARDLGDLRARAAEGADVGRHRPAAARIRDRMPAGGHGHRSVRRVGFDIEKARGRAIEGLGDPSDHERFPKIRFGDI